MRDKLLPNMDAAFTEAGIADGMTLSFHHHLRNGDFVLNAVVETAAKRGIKGLTLATSSVFPIHEPLIEHIKNGVVTCIDTDYMVGSVARFISEGNLPNPVMFRSHGGRPRAIREGSLPIDVAFVGAPTVDPLGNISGWYGKSACGALGYAVPDAECAKTVVAVTDNLLKEPLEDIAIPHDRVSHIVCMESIGNPSGIVSGSTAMTRDPVAHAIARKAQAAILASGLLRNGFNFQTGAGGASLATAQYLREDMRRLGLRGGFLLGGITKYLVDMLEEGLFERIYDVQCFDLAAVDSIRRNKTHQEISADTYANPSRRGCCVDALDVVLLGASEIDINFNVNVHTNSNGIIIGGSGGHNDAAAGAKMTIIVAPLIRARLPIVVERCTTITTPGKTVDVLVTERGIAVNPARPELAERFRDAGLAVYPIEQLRAMALELTGIPKKIVYTDKVVGTVEYRDGTILDSIYAPA